MLRSQNVWLRWFIPHAHPFVSETAAKIALCECKALNGLSEGPTCTPGKTWSKDRCSASLSFLIPPVLWALQLEIGSGRFTRRVKGRQQPATESESFRWVSLEIGVKIRSGRNGDATHSLRIQRLAEGDAVNITTRVKTELWYSFRSMNPMLRY